MSHDKYAPDANDEVTTGRLASPVTPGVLVSGRDPVWAVGLCTFFAIGGFCLAGVMIVSARGITPPAFALLLASGGLIAISLVFSFVLGVRRRYLRPTETGFLYTTISGERAFVDDDVMCVSLTSTPNFFGGNATSVTRRFIMWVETGGMPESIICIAHLRLGQPDPLAGLISRLIRCLHTAAREAYDAGQRVEGDGWALERGELLLKSKAATTVTNIRELAAVEVVGDHIQVWRRGEEQPIGRIPSRTANAHLLLLMLQELIPEPQDEQDLPAGSLGRLLFERGPGGHTLFALGWLITIVLGIGCILMFIRGAGLRGRRRIRLQMFAALAGAITVLLATILRLRQRGRFRRHVYGIQQKGMFGTRQVRFTEIANMSYAATRAYVHGVYAGTTLTLTFVPMPSTGLRQIRYSTTVKNADSELDKLRDDVSVVIARRMHDYWLQNGSCPWMQFLKFAKDGLEYQALTFTGRKQPKLIPYESIANFTIDDMMFHIWDHEHRTPLVNEDIGQPNFYPGLVFLSEILQTLPEKRVPLLPGVERD